MFRKFTKVTNSGYFGAFLDAGGVDLEDKDLENNTLLHRAAAANNLGAVEVLLSRGADFRAINFYGQEPIERAIEAGGYKATMALLNLYGDGDMEYKFHLLNFAKRASSAEIIGLLQQDIRLSAESRERFPGELRDKPAGLSSIVYVPVDPKKNSPIGKDFGRVDGHLDPGSSPASPAPAAISGAGRAGGL